MPGIDHNAARYWAAPTYNTSSKAPTYQPVGSNAQNAAAAAYANAMKNQGTGAGIIKNVVSSANKTASAAKNQSSAPVASSSGGGSSSGSYSGGGGGGGIDYMSLISQWQNQMRQAAEEAYNRGKAALEEAYASRTKSLLDNYNSSKDQLAQTYGVSKSGIEADAAKSLREAYINNMLNKRDMNQLLSAQGLSGGASESTLAKMLNNYGNNRNNINTATNRNLLELETSHNANLADALRNYNDALADAQERRTQYLMQLEQNRASGIANSIPAFGTLMSMFG